MTEDGPRAYFREYARGWEEHDVGLVMAQFADGGTYEDPVVDHPIRGADLRAYVRRTMTAFPDLSFDGTVVHAPAADTIVNEWRGTGTNTGPYLGYPPTDRDIDVDGVSVFTIADDGVTHARSYFDRSTVHDQLGLTFPSILRQAPTLAYRAVTRRWPR